MMTAGAPWRLVAEEAPAWGGGRHKTPPRAREEVEGSHVLQDFPEPSRMLQKVKNPSMVHSSDPGPRLPET